MTKDFKIKCNKCDSFSLKGQKFCSNCGEKLEKNFKTREEIEHEIDELLVSSNIPDPFSLALVIMTTHALKWVMDDTEVEPSKLIKGMIEHKGSGRELIEKLEKEEGISS